MNRPTEEQIAALKNIGKTDINFFSEDTSYREILDYMREEAIRKQDFSAYQDALQLLKEEDSSIDFRKILIQDLGVENIFPEEYTYEDIFEICVEEAEYERG